MDPQARLHPQSPGAETARATHGPAADATGAPPSFAHASEAELARILDFYGVAWEYEPRTFPLVWSLGGQVTESFTPDFYLPELELFLELTTLRQKLVRKKNRKLRRLREVYPDVRIKLLYAKDFRALMLKFGRIGLADTLSGTVGQTTPPRAARSEPSPRHGAHVERGEAGTVRDARRSPARSRVAAGAAPVPDRPAAAEETGRAEGSPRPGRRARRASA